MKEFLSRKNVSYTERDVDGEPLDAQELWTLFNRKMNRLRVPFTALNDGEDVVLGYDPMRLEEVFVHGFLHSRVGEASPEEQVVYDDFTSSEVDLERWSVVQLKAPDGSLVACTDPNAKVRTGNGGLEVEINPFTRFRDDVQILNNPKQLYVSARRFETPPGTEVEFATDLAVTTYNQIPYNLRDAFGTLNLLDFSTGMVLDFAASNDCLFVVYERLLLPGVTTKEDYFCHRVVLEVEAKPGARHHYAIRYNRDTNHADWYLDGQHVYWADLPVPVEGFNLGMGLFSSREIDRFSRAEREHGQGATGRWGPWVVTTRYTGMPMVCA